MLLVKFLQSQMHFCAFQIPEELLHGHVVGLQVGRNGRFIMYELQEHFFSILVKVQKIAAVAVSLTGIRSQQLGSCFRLSLSVVMPVMILCITIYTSITSGLCIVSYIVLWLSVLPSNPSNATFQSPHR